MVKQFLKIQPVFSIGLCFLLLNPQFSFATTNSVCGSPATLISSIQGASSKSPLVDELHTVEAIVIASFQDQNELRGFFIQEETIHQDSNPKSSEGIFVFHQATPVKAGQLIRLSGEVKERFGQTQISNVSDIIVCDTNALQRIQTSIIRLPNTSANTLEAFEGMMVRLKGKNIVSDNYNLGRYGEFVVSNKSRLSIPTQLVKPGIDATNRQEENNLNRLIIDDGRYKQNIDPIAYPAPNLSAMNTMRAGQRVKNIIGVLTYAFGNYRLHPTKPVRFSKNLRPESPQDDSHDEEFIIASFNVQNFFNGDGLGNDFPTSRGADSYAEFQRQEVKLGQTIAALGAAVIGIAEIENDGYSEQSAITSLVNQINSVSHEHYAFIRSGSNQLGSDAIAVGLLYNPELVTPVGDVMTLTTPPFDSLSRQPLAQNFIFNETNSKVLVVMNHFKSKRCRGAKNADKNQKDGQGCYNATRVESATQVINWIERISTTPYKIILGDFNSYAQEDPVQTFVNAGYRNKLDGKKDYTYSFRGQAGVLDYILYNEPLDEMIKSVNVWHINADEPRILDYNEEFKSESQLNTLFNNDSFRSSDHDPVYIVIDLHDQKIDD